MINCNHNSIFSPLFKTNTFNMVSERRANVSLGDALHDREISPHSGLHTFFPVGTLPVKETLATTGCRQSKEPVSAPPCTTQKSPSGTPASL